MTVQIHWWHLVLAGCALFAIRAADAQLSTPPIKTVKTIPFTTSAMRPPGDDGLPLPRQHSNPLPPDRPERIVIAFGNGGRVAEHQLKFEGYRRTGVSVEMRGPCYSACTLITAYLEPDHLCFAQGAFMAFHAVRGLYSREIMMGETLEFYRQMPEPIRRWIDRNGGYDKLPLDGFWTMYDHELWAMGYPKCK